jgi:hypothetical protein
MNGDGLQPFDGAGKNGGNQNEILLFVVLPGDTAIGRPREDFKV